MKGGKDVLQLALGAVASAGLTFGLIELTSGRHMTVALLVATALPAFLAKVGRRLPGWASAMVQVAVGLAGLAILARAEPSALVSGLTSGWSQLLSTTLPADPTPSVLVPLTALVWFVAAATSEVVVRGKAVFLPALPLAGGAVAARLIEGDNVGRSSALGACVGVGALVVLVAIRADAAADLPRGRLGLPFSAAALPAIGVAALAAIFVGGAIPAAVGARDRPFDPRALREVAPAAADVRNPLAMVRAARLDREPELAQVTTSSPADDVPVYLRLVALDRYDGSIWSSTSQYRVAGVQLPAPGPGGPTTVPLRQEVVVKGLDTPWVAVADRPVRVQGVSVLHDGDQGTLAATADDPLESEQRYRVDSLVPRPDPVGLANANSDARAELAGFRVLPAGIPPSFATEAGAAVTNAAGSDFARLAALQSYFTEGYAVEETEPGGQSLAQLAGFITPARRVAPSSSEFAAAFALMARTLGFSSRVVVGFAPFPAGGTRTLRRGDLHAWPEVALRGFGWVPFEPTPRDRSEPDPRDAEVPVASPAALASAVAADQSAGPGGGPGPGTIGPGSSRSRTALARWTAALAAATVGVFLVLACPPLLKARRRRRRRLPGEPAERVLGAWAEALDRLGERGVARDRTASSRDVSHRAAARLGSSATPPVSELGSLATAAACGPPGSLDPSHADAAWAATGNLAQVLRTGSIRDRMRAAVDPRPLLRRPRR